MEHLFLIAPVLYTGIIMVNNQKSFQPAINIPFPTTRQAKSKMEQQVLAYQTALKRTQELLELQMETFLLGMMIELTVIVAILSPMIPI